MIYKSCTLTMTDTPTMTYTPKTKRPTVKSMQAEIKRLREVVKVDQEIIDCGVSQQNDLRRDLTKIADLAITGNEFGQRTKTINAIREIAVAHVT